MPCFRVNTRCKSSSKKKKKIKKFQSSSNVSCGNMTQQYINFHSDEIAYVRGLLTTQF